MRIFVLFLMLVMAAGASGQAVSRTELRNTNTLIDARTVRSTNGIQRGLTTNQGRIQFQTANTNTYQFGGNGTIFSVLDNVSGITWFSYDHATDRLTETLGTHEVVGTIKAQNYQSSLGNSGNTATDAGVVFENGLLISGSPAALANKFTTDGTISRLATNFPGFVSNVFNIQSFGADPTGVKDSSPAIQSAINTAGSSARILFPAGTYLIRTTLTNYDKQDVIWEGQSAGSSLSAWPSDASILQWAGATNGGILDFDRSKGYIFRGLSFDNPHTNAASYLVSVDQKDNTSSNGWGITTQITFDRCMFRSRHTNALHLIKMLRISESNSADNCEQFRILNCSFTGFGLGLYPSDTHNHSYGVWLGTNNNALNYVIDGGSFEYCTNGLFVGTAGVTVQNMLFNANHTALAFAGASQPAMIINNRSEGERRFAYCGPSQKIYYFLGNVATAITSWTNTTALIQIAATTEFVFIGNTFGQAAKPDVPIFRNDPTYSPSLTSIGNKWATNDPVVIGLGEFTSGVTEIASAGVPNVMLVGTDEDFKISTFIKTRGTNLPWLKFSTNPYAIKMAPDMPFQLGDRNPTAKLDVFGSLGNNLAVFGDTNVAERLLLSRNGVGSVLTLKGGDNSTYYVIQQTNGAGVMVGYLEFGSDTSASYLAFNNGLNFNWQDGGVTRMALGTNGNLNVNGGITASNLTLTTAPTNATPDAFAGFVNGQLVHTATPAGGAAVGTNFANLNATNGLTVRTNVLRVTDSGVAINKTSAASAPLDITASSGDDIAYYRSSAGALRGYTGLSSASGALQYHVYSGAGVEQILISGLGINNYGLNAGSGFTFGINTNLPQAALHVNGNALFDYITAFDIGRLGVSPMLSIRTAGTTNYTAFHLPNVTSNAAPVSYAAFDDAGRIYEAAAPAGGAGTPAGNSGALQFVETGAFAGTNELRFDRTNRILFVPQAMYLSNTASSVVLQMDTAAGEFTSAQYWTHAGKYSFGELVSSNAWRLVSDIGSSGPHFIEAVRNNHSLTFGIGLLNVITNNAITYFNSNAFFSGTTTFDAMSIGKLVVTSNEVEFAASANHQIDGNVAPDWIGTNSMAQHTALSFTNYNQGTNHHIFSIFLEGDGGTTDYNVTNLVQSGDLIAVNEGALATSATLVVTQKTILKILGERVKIRNTNQIRLTTTWGTR